MTVLLTAVAVSQTDFPSKMYTASETSEQNNLSDWTVEESTDSPVTIDTSSSEVWDTEDVYLFRSGYSTHLDRDATVMVPQENRTPYISKNIDIPDEDIVKAGITARNAALLINQPVKWNNVDCGKSRLSLKARGSEDINETRMVDNVPETVEIDISELRGQNTDLRITLGESTDCGSRENEAAYIKDIYIEAAEPQLRDHSISLQLWSKLIN